jgi:hypothetical protein
MNAGGVHLVTRRRPKSFVAAPFEMVTVTA